MSLKRIMIHKFAETEPVIWDISDENLFKKAMLELFIFLDTTCVGMYDNLKSLEDYKICDECDGNRVIKLKTGVYTCPKCDGYSRSDREIEKLKNQKALYDAAKKGDAKSAYLLLNERKDDPGQGWKVYSVK